MGYVHQHLSFFIRSAISITILVYLGFHLNWAEMAAIAQEINLGWLFFAIFLFGPVFLITAWRWQLLLEVQGIQLHYWPTLQLNMVGQFFNAFLLGVTGGDVIKIYYAAKAAPKKRSAAGLSVIMDRLIGLSVLLVLALVLCFFQFSSLTKNTQTRAATYVVLLISALSACVLFGAFSLPYLKRWIVKKGWRVQLPFIDVLKKLYEVGERYAKAWGVMVIAFFLSFINHSLNFLSAYCIAVGLGLAIPFWQLMSIIPIVLLLVAIPISISGLGFRELLFVTFFVPMGISQEHAITFSFIFFSVTLFWSLLGGIFYLRYETPPDVAIEELSHL